MMECGGGVRNPWRAIMGEGEITKTGVVRRVQEHSGTYERGSNRAWHWAEKKENLLLPAPFRGGEGGVGVGSGMGGPRMYGDHLGGEGGDEVLRAQRGVEAVPRGRGRPMWADVS